MFNTIISAGATILVAIIGLIGIIIQAKSHTKIKKNEDILNSVNKQIEDLRKESKADDARLNKRLDDIDLYNCKCFLIVEMTKINDGTYHPSEEQKRIIHEMHERYNEEGRKQLCRSYV